MFVFKAVLYILTIGSMFFFAGWERRLRRRLTEEGLQQQRESLREYPFDFSTIREEFRREHILMSLPPEALSRYKAVVILKFVFFAILILEVIVLQR